MPSASPRPCARAPGGRARGTAQGGDSEPRAGRAASGASTAFGSRPPGRRRRLRGQLREAELGREEAQTRIQELEGRLGCAAEDAAGAPSREQGLEMECNLLRSRFAKQVASCQAAERALTESRAQQNHLKAGLERSTGEVRHLRQKLAEAQDAAVD
ncbi:unnamed protein product [Prorocentrum cordatum]|uniref:Uncharacterized protein n=1 Tax=Prorocentrum cordatum TaxID=2364126 RepID=A0ABN9UJ89_9DINO|nr:unnamed protein product [Polarella glacialis]